jgi:hypothetical protein
MIMTMRNKYRSTYGIPKVIMRVADKTLRKRDNQVSVSAIREARRHGYPRIMKWFQVC